MSQSELSILVVDDAKFSSAVIMRNLKAGGYHNVSHAESAIEALGVLEKAPINIVIADWLMPEMDGLEMTKRIRQMDEANNTYTYVIMLTARDGIDALKHAFDEGVDDFVNKSAMQQQLLPRVFAAERLVNNQNRLLRDFRELLQANQQLDKANKTLKELSTIDPLTGLGNKNYNLNKLGDNLSHTESRGGATCYLLIRINGIAELEKKMPPRIVNELIVGISRRLKSLVRPLDDVSRLTKYTFAVVTHQPDLTLCVGSSFKRIVDAINHRAFQTSMGFMEVTVDMAVAAAGAKTGLPTAEQLMAMAEDKLKESIDTQRIQHIHYKKVE